MSGFSSARAPKAFSTRLLSLGSPSLHTYLGLHLSLLNLIWFTWTHFSCLSRTLWMLFLPSVLSVAPASLVSSANLLKVHSIPLSRLLINSTQYALCILRLLHLCIYICIYFYLCADKKKNVLHQGLFVFFIMDLKCEHFLKMKTWSFVAHWNQSLIMTFYKKKNCVRDFKVIYFKYLPYFYQGVVNKKWRFWYVIVILSSIRNSHLLPALLGNHVLK